MPELIRRLLPFKRLLFEIQSVYFIIIIDLSIIYVQVLILLLLLNDRRDLYHHIGRMHMDPRGIKNFNLIHILRRL